MSEKDPRLVESPVKFSDSKIWQIQRNYFATMGIEAWKEEVPYYISSNAFIGHRYALLVLNFIRDYLKKHHDHHETFYILETGSGTGKFSFYFLSAFKELLKIYQLDTIKFRYIITDIIEKNIEFCRENISLLPFLQSDCLDFASYDVEKDGDFYLTIQQKYYSDLKVKTPLIIIANYTFDCTKQDSLIYLSNEVLSEKLGLRSRYKNFDIKNAKHLNELRLEFDAEPVLIENYYSNPILNELLQEYRQLFKENTTVMIPLGAIQCVDHLKKLTQGKFFMIIGDKGISKLENLRLLTEKYRISFDGCFAFTINFHALAYYFKKLGGDYLHTDRGNVFNVNLYSMGIEIKDLPETAAFYKALISSLGPEEYCCMYDEYIACSYRFPVLALLGFLRESQWDPDVYAAIHHRLIELLPTVDPLTERYILSDLEKVRLNVYRMNIGQDVYNLLGLYFETQKQEDKALELYEQSIEVFGNRAAPHINAALIYENKKNIPKALYHYQRAINLDKKNRFAKNKIAILTGKPYLTAIIPIFKALVIVVFIGTCFYLLTR